MFVGKYLYISIKQQTAAIRTTACLPDLFKYKAALELLHRLALISTASFLMFQTDKVKALSFFLQQGRVLNMFGPLAFLPLFSPESTPLLGGHERSLAIPRIIQLHASLRSAPLHTGSIVL